MTLRVQADLDLQDNDLSNITSFSPQIAYMGTLSSTPSDSDFAGGQVALYFKNDENLYKKPHGGSESRVGGSGSGGKSEEEIEDIVAALLNAGNNTSLNYDDANDTLTINSTDSTLTNEQVEDIVGTLVSGGNDIDVTYDDAGDSLIVDYVGSGTDTRTDISDSGGTVVADTNDITFTSSSNASVTVSSDGDGSGTVDISATDTTLSEEQVDDFVANLLVGGNDIDTTYDDASDSLTIDFTGSSTSGDSRRASVPLRSELQSGSALGMGVPVPDGSSLEIHLWGVSTSDNTTPNGLLAQLTEPGGSVIQQENTTLTRGSPIVTTSNSSGSVKWYRLRIKNETGTDYIDGNTPDSVIGNFEYKVV